MNQEEILHGHTLQRDDTLNFPLRMRVLKDVLQVSPPVRGHLELGVLALTKERKKEENNKKIAINKIPNIEENL